MNEDKKKSLLQEFTNTQKGILKIDEDEEYRQEISALQKDKIDMTKIDEIFKMIWQGIKYD